MFFLLFLLQGCNVLFIFTLCTLLLFLFEHRFVVVVLFSRLLLHFICLLEQCCIFSIIAFFCHILLFLFILLFCSGSDSLRTPSRSGELCCLAQSAGQLSSSSTWQSVGPKSSVDDLCAGRGVV